MRGLYHAGVWPGRRAVPAQGERGAKLPGTTWPGRLRGAGPDLEGEDWRTQGVGALDEAELAVEQGRSPPAIGEARWLITGVGEEEDLECQLTSDIGPPELRYAGALVEWREDVVVFFDRRLADHLQHHLGGALQFDHADL